MSLLKQPSFSKSFPLVKKESPQPARVEELAASFPQHQFSHKASIVAVNEQLKHEFQLDDKSIKDWEPFLLGQQTSDLVFAYNYGGHQFGQWADQLGDGRALVIGQWTDSKGQNHELQLKGSGPTPFSRRGDGFAVLRSSVREYLASESMHQLNIPTTRALSLGLTGENVLRDKFYDGNASYETGAIVCRTAPSFLRFGNFELLSSRRDKQGIEKLLHFVIDNFYPHLNDSSKNTNDLVADLFSEILNKTAFLISQWQSVGFTHGVMNTDNMSILGLTIDYGPYGFMEQFSPTYTPNTTDLPGRRYCYGRQASIAAWNLSCLGSTWLEFCSEEQLVSILKTFDQTFSQFWVDTLTKKLGFESFGEEEKAVVQDLFELLEKKQADMNYFFRELSQSLRDNTSDRFIEIFGDDWQPWLTKYQELLNNPEEAGERMCAVNPRLVIKNHIAQRVIDDIEKGSTEELETITKLIMNPFKDWQDHDEWYKPAPDWALSKDVQMNSCSS